MQPKISVLSNLVAATVFGCLFFACLAGTADKSLPVLVGKVVKVVDGDTLDVALTVNAD